MSISDRERLRKSRIVRFTTAAIFVLSSVRSLLLAQQSFLDSLLPTSNGKQSIRAHALNNPNHIPLYDQKYLNWLHDEQFRDIEFPFNLLYRCQSGIGHQLLRLAAAYHLAMLYKIPRIYPTSNPMCSGNIFTIHNYLLGPYHINSTLVAPLLVDVPYDGRYNIYKNRSLFQLPKHFPNLTYVPTQEQSNTTTSTSISINNNLPGYQLFFDKRYAAYIVKNNYWGKDESDYQMYSQFMDLFSQQHSSRIKMAMRQINFEQHTVFGLHVRAGNGETGDFVKKKRGMVDLDAWLTNVIELLCDYKWHHTRFFQEHPLMLFVATDTASVIPKLQSASKKRCKIPIVSAEQSYPQEGDGVSFQATVDERKTQEECLNGWRDMVLDMYLMSQCNTVIAGTYSSFTQAAPLSFVMQKAKLYNHEVTDTSTVHPHYFCEVGVTGHRMDCFGSLDSWFINEPTDSWGDISSLRHIRKYELTYPIDQSSKAGEIQDFFKGTALSLTNQ